MLRLLLLLLLLQANNTALDEHSTGREGSTSLTETYVYQDSEYIFFSEKVTWTESRFICSAYKARLAVVDNIFKANFIAESMAFSDMELQYLWIGARYIHLEWSWISTGSKLAPENHRDGFPPWRRGTKRPGKDCVAVGRKGHDTPMFVDLECRLLHPFACEKRIGDDTEKPLPTQHGVVEGVAYTLYHGHVTWKQAVATCRVEGMRIARVQDNKVAEVLADYMLKSRPDIENLWIGGVHLRSQWRWITTGQIVPTQTGRDGYPPWRINATRKDSGCVMLDRHLCDHPVFIEIHCGRKRSFVCEQPLLITTNTSKNITIELPTGKLVFMYIMKRTWSAAYQFCNETGGTLLILRRHDELEAIMDAMADLVEEPRHVWVGGKLRGDQWVWAASGDSIVGEGSSLPMCEESSSEDRSCLNLDRQGYNTPLLYGLHCNTSQPFICEQESVNCSREISNGSWRCYQSATGIANCFLKCASQLFVFGSRKVTCSTNGTVTGYESLEFPPQCLSTENLVDKLYKTLRDIIDHQKADGILFLVDGNKKEYANTLKFIKPLMSKIQLNDKLHAGVISYAGPENLIRLSEEDSCKFLKLLATHAGKKDDNFVSIGLGFVLALQEILNYNRRTCIIILCWDGKNDIPDTDSYTGTVGALNRQGHFIFAIGEEADMHDQLVPFVTINNDAKEYHMYIIPHNAEDNPWTLLEGYKAAPLLCND